VLVELDFGFRQVEINRAALIAPAVEQPRELAARSSAVPGRT